MRTRTVGCNAQMDERREVDNDGEHLEEVDLSDGVRRGWR